MTATRPDHQAAILHPREDTCDRRMAQVDVSSQRPHCHGLQPLNRMKGRQLGGGQPAPLEQKTRMQVDSSCDSPQSCDHLIFQTEGVAHSRDAPNSTNYFQHNYFLLDTLFVNHIPTSEGLDCAVVAYFRKIVTILKLRRRWYHAESRLHTINTLEAHPLL